MLTVGAEVIVRALRKRGTVTSVLGPGVYRVAVGAMTTTASEEELELPPAPSKKKAARARSAQPAESASAAPGAGAAGLASVDLHGLGVEEARNKVAGHISRAILAGLDKVEIIHGIGTGKLKAAIVRDLEALGAVRAVKPHPTNPGVTIAYL